MDRLLEIVLGNAGSALLLALAVGLVARHVRRPALVHSLWLLVLLRLLAPPVLELALMPAAQLSSEQHEFLSAPIELAAAVPVSAFAHETPSRFRLDTFAVVLWGGGALLFLGLALIRSLRLRKLLQATTSAGETVRTRLDRVARQMGLGHPPRLKMIQGGAPPMIWGLPGSPTLILPADLVDSLDQAELDALIAHELAHVKRRDHWVRGLELLSSLIFWWHPVTWWARKRLRSAEELCCDLMVARALPNHRKPYAQCLLKTLRYLRAQPTPLHAGSAMASLDDLKGRITMIMQDSKTRHLPLSLRLGGLALAALLLCLSPTLAARQNTEPPQFTGEPITLALDGARLSDVLNTFAEVSEINFALDPRAVEGGFLDDQVTINFNQVPWDQALDTILAVHGLIWRREGKIIWILPGWSTLDGDRKFSGEPITMNLKDADIHDVLRTFSELTEVQFDIDPGFEARVSLEFNEIPWDQALEAILRTSGLEAVPAGEGAYTLQSTSTTSGAILPTREDPAPPSVPSQRAPDEVHRFIVGGEISEPEPISRSRPVYPADAKEKGIRGVVVLDALIDAEGNVAEVEVLRREGYGLTEAAVAAVKTWKYYPAMLEDEPVAVRYLLTVRFSPDGD